MKAMNKDSAEKGSPFVVTALEYSRDSSNILLNNIAFYFLRARSKLFHHSISLSRIKQIVTICNPRK
jgi:hypothetical protein